MVARGKCRKRAASARGWRAPSALRACNYPLLRRQYGCSVSSSDCKTTLGTALAPPPQRVQRVLFFPIADIFYRLHNVRSERDQLRWLKRGTGLKGGSYNRLFSVLQAFDDGRLHRVQRRPLELRSDSQCSTSGEWIRIGE
mmetsp:Transcript_70188/g.156358  ORF Transcript_70188/g.156358 Transcript_70188/m.156358 type:complete len:141 (-) Transcript_70188:541-963(-)